MNIKKEMTIAALVFSICMPFTASAQSPDAKESMATQNAVLDSYTQEINRWRGLRLTAKIDWSNFTEKDISSKNAPGYCRGTLQAINVFSLHHKDAVAQNIKTIVCKLGTERTVDLKDGTLTLVMTWKDYNQGQFVGDYLKRVLQ